jgi:hypothetical protein
MEEWSFRTGQGLRGNAIEYLYGNFKPKRTTWGVEDNLFLVF